MFAHGRGLPRRKANAKLLAMTDGVAGLLRMTTERQ